MALLILGIIVFLGIHLLPTFPDIRTRLIRRFGPSSYKGLFAIVAIAGIVLLAFGFAKAPVVDVWSPPDWTRYVAIVLMLPAFILVVAAYVPGAMKAKLKHPFLVGIMLWALAHLIAVGDLASIILFASFLAYAAYDRIAVERREETGFVTVSETGPGRNDWISLALGLALYVAFLVWLHPLLIGSAPLP
jgi:uncharacterized membrane protein